jgi:hypothetical protein
MSSISFPHAAHDHTASVVSASSVHENGYFNDASSAFATSSTSSFQMNPLSPHPPRTPRTSVTVSTNHVYGGDIYTPKEEVLEERPEYFSDDEEDSRTQQEARRRVRKEDVWREMVKTSYGRDKALVRHRLFFLLLYTPSSSSLL